MFYQYHVLYYDEWSEDEAHDEGIVFARSLSEALDKVIDIYGETNLYSILRLEPIDEILDRGTLDYIKWDIDESNCCKL